MKNLIYMKTACFAMLSGILLMTACGGTYPPPCAEETEIKSGVSDMDSEILKEDSKPAVTLTHDLARGFRVDSPERPACLIASFADIWYLAGGADQIVAATGATWTYFDLPLREDVVNLGAAKELNLEELIACNPDFILASCGTDRNRELESSFEKMGLTVAYFQVDTFDDYLRVLKVCTEITGFTENYKIYGSDVRAQVTKALERADGSRPKVLYIRATGSNCKVKGSRENVLGEMLANLDCDNIADSENSLLEQLGMEAILESDPDYIFVVLQSADPADAQKVLESTLLQNPAWNTLRAVREGRYYVMDPGLYNLKPNERWGEAYEKLADILYPVQ